MKRWEREKSRKGRGGGVGDCMDPMVLHCLEGPWRQPAEQEGTDLVEVKSPRTREPFLRGCPAPQSLEGQQPSRLVASGPPGRRQTAGFGRLRRTLLELWEETSPACLCLAPWA